MDEKENSSHRSDGTWIDHFEANLKKIAIRRAPLWNQGLIEAAWLIRIDSSNPPGRRIAKADDSGGSGKEFFEALLDELYLREPALRPDRG
ncbi:hypothetical protein IMX07_09765 [bacterium]|nr:hypothetical protein [bacterium]